MGIRAVLDRLVLVYKLMFFYHSAYRNSLFVESCGMIPTAFFICALCYHNIKNFSLKEVQF